MLRPPVPIEVLVMLQLLLYLALAIIRKPSTSGIKRFTARVCSRCLQFPTGAATWDALLKQQRSDLYAVAVLLMRRCLPFPAGSLGKCQQTLLG